MFVLEVAFLAIFWSWVFCGALFLRNTFLPKAPVWVSPHMASLLSETVRFQATDGLWLAGRKISGDPSRPWLILCHGVGSNRADLLDIGAGLHEAGFNLLLFDFRGHGGSGGSFTSYGLTEQRDLEGALSFLGSQTDIAPKPYGVYGISMGGSVSLMVASRDERIQALVVDSPYSDLDTSIARHLKLMYPWLPRQPFLSFIRLTYWLRYGSWLTQVSPVKAASRLRRQQALLVISGSQDVRMPPEEIHRICKANPEAECWQIEGAGHLEGFSIDPAAYSKRLIQFYKHKLG